MALPSSGVIKFSDINVELGVAANTPRRLSDAAVRTLFAVPSGTIRFSNGFGKSNRFATNLIPQFLFKQEKNGTSVTGAYEGGGIIYDGTGDETYIISQPGDNANGILSGSVYRFDKNGTLLGRIAPTDAGSYKRFGVIATNGKNVLVGAPGYSSQSGSAAPSAYLFNSSMTQVAKLAPTGSIEQNGLWGYALAVGPESTNICAGLFYNASARTTAQLRIFNATTGAQLYARSVTGMSDNGYGFGCVITKTNILVVQAPYYPYASNPSGAIWVHDLQGNYISKITAPAPYSNTNDNVFGFYTTYDPITNYVFVASAIPGTYVVNVYDENLNYRYTMNRPSDSFNAVSWPQGIGALDGTLVIGDRKQFYYYSYNSTAATQLAKVVSPDSLGTNDGFGTVNQLWKGSDGGQRAVIQGYANTTWGLGRIYIYK
jgi:hypothetical protein